MWRIGCHITSLLLIFLSGTAVAAAEWQEYRSEEGGFTALFPGTPKANFEPADKSGVAAHEFVVGLGQIAYAVSYNDFAPNTFAGKNPQRILDRARDRLVKGQPVKLLADKPVKTDNHIGREVVFEESDGYTQVYRIYVVKDRLYETITGGPKGSDKSPETIRFHDSFRFIGQ